MIKVCSNEETKENSDQAEASSPTPDEGNVDASIENKNDENENHIHERQGAPGSKMYDADKGIWGYGKKLIEVMNMKHILLLFQCHITMTKKC